MKSSLAVFLLTISFSTLALFTIGKDKDGTNKDKEKTAEECEIPAFAKAIGHEDQWLLHNGCPPRKTVEKQEKKN